MEFLECEEAPVRGPRLNMLAVLANQKGFRLSARGKPRLLDIPVTGTIRSERNPPAIWVPDVGRVLAFQHGCTGDDSRGSTIDIENPNVSLIIMKQDAFAVRRKPRFRHAALSLMDRAEATVAIHPREDGGLGALSQIDDRS